MSDQQKPGAGPLPNADDAERHLLACLLHGTETMADVVQILSVQDFHSDVHRQIYSAILACWDRGFPCELVAVGNVLAERGRLCKEVPPAYFAELYDLAATSGAAVYYATVIKDKSILRGCLLAAQQISHLGADGKMPGPELLEVAERAIFAISMRTAGGNAQFMQQIVDAAADEIEKRSLNPQRLGVMTGLIDLDAILCGLKGGQLIIVGARPSVGKTALACSWSLNAGKNGTGVLFFSLEQSNRELGERFLVMESGLNSHDCLRGLLEPAEWQTLIAARDKAGRLPIIADDASAMSITKIAAVARAKMHREKIGLVVIDYLQLVTPEGSAGNREQEIAGITRRAKLLARELNVPLVLLAQLNRGVEEGHGREPRLSDLRESGAQEQDADVVLLLWRPQGKRQDDVEIIEALVAKNRNGRTGPCNLAFRRASMRFENLAPEGF